MTWKKRVMALLLAAVSIFGVACGENNDDVEDDTTEEMSEED